MNTQTQVLRLDAGQALPQPRRGGGTWVLAEGELAVQEPARWLAGMVVVPARRQVIAPAVLAADPGTEFVATRPCSVVIHGTAPFRWRAARAWLRAALRNRRGTGESPAAA